MAKLQPQNPIIKMNVHGHEITPEQIQTATSFAMSGKHFTYADLTKVLINCGVLKEDRYYQIASRAADRLLQRLSKAKQIKFNGSNWQKVSPKPDLEKPFHEKIIESAWPKKKAAKAAPAPKPAQTTTITKLTGTWRTRCAACGREYKNGCGSSPCCGALQEVISKKPAIPEGGSVYTSTYGYVYTFVSHSKKGEITALVTNTKGRLMFAGPIPLAKTDLAYTHFASLFPPGTKADISSLTKGQAAAEKVRQRCNQKKIDNDISVHALAALFPSLKPFAEEVKKATGNPLWELCRLAEKTNNRNTVYAVEFIYSVFRSGTMFQTYNALEKWDTPHLQAWAEATRRLAHHHSNNLIK